ncbi:MAG: site-specific DNA-methyltransferase [Nitrosopumilus sp.]
MSFVLGKQEDEFFTSKTGLIYHGDCIDLLSLIKPETIDCIFADPPFNLNKNYGPLAQDNSSNDEYISWCEKWINECIRVLKPGSAFFLYNIPKWAHKLAMLIENNHMVFRYWIAISMKNNYPRGNGLYPAHYALLYFTKGEPEVVNKLRIPIPLCRHCGKEIKDYGGHRHKINEEGLNLSDFWDDLSPVRHHKFKKRSANELNPKIPERAILLSTKPNDIILDPFGGGGTTYMIAEKNNRLWVGSEIEDCLPILKRLEDETGVIFDQIPDKNIMDIFRDPVLEEKELV